MDQDRRITALEGSLDRHLGWISSANDRTSTAVTLALAMLGILAAVSPNQMDKWTCAQALFAGIAAITLVACLFMCLLAVFPRTTPPYDSLVFFGTIAKKSHAEFEQAARGYSASDYLGDLTRQVHVNAIIAATKFRWVQNAMRALFLAVVPWVAAVYLLYGAS